MTLRIASILVLLATGCAQGPGGGKHSFRPERVPFTQDKLKQLKVPAGFGVNVWASGLGNPRMIAVGDDGTVYVTRYNQGDLLAFKDINGKAEQRKPLAQLDGLHGIALRGNSIYLATVHELYSAEIKQEGS